MKGVRHWQQSTEKKTALVWLGDAKRVVLASLESSSWWGSFCESSASEVESSLPERHFCQRYFSPHFILILSEKQCPREAASSADSNVDGDKLVTS